MIARMFFILVIYLFTSLFFLIIMKIEYIKKISRTELFMKTILIIILESGHLKNMEKSRMTILFKNLYWSGKIKSILEFGAFFMLVFEIISPISFIYRAYELVSLFIVFALIFYLGHLYVEDFIIFK